MVKGKWKRKLYFGGGQLLSVLSKLIPKDSRRICFFCKSGLDDNSEALFDLGEGLLVAAFSLALSLLSWRNAGDYAYEEADFCKLLAWNATEKDQWNAG